MTVELSPAPRHHPQAELSPIAWVGSPELAYDEWLHQGARLGLAGRSAGWWVGDWVRYGTARYGNKYSAAARVTGYDRQTLMNMVYVATRFQISRRREHLSWSHHAHLAALEVEEQERWLDYSTTERLSVRDLRDALATMQGNGRKGGRRGAADEESSASATTEATGRDRSDDIERASSKDAAAARAVVCPHCGHHFSA
jgi:hypothetical protein